MVNRNKIKKIVHLGNLTITDQLLLILAIDSVHSKKVQEILAIALEIGIRAAKKWNISSKLSRAVGKAVLTNEGWELGPLGIERIRELGIDPIASGSDQIAEDLRSVANSVSNSNVRPFIDEAISNLENKCYRSAIVISWIGATATLYNHVIANKLAEFNSEAKRRNTKWKNAANFDDIADMKEDTFLDICHSISVIGKSVKDELKSRLKMRNGAGHPNTFSVGENMVKAHIESLINNVYKKF